MTFIGQTSQRQSLKFVKSTLAERAQTPGRLIISLISICFDYKGHQRGLTEHRVKSTGGGLFNSPFLCL